LRLPLAGSRFAIVVSLSDSPTSSSWIAPGFGLVAEALPLT
jgi:hypothetical protein